MVALRVLFAGSGAFGLPTLRALVGAGHDLVRVISQPDRPAGRGRKLTPTPIAAYAVEQDLTLLRTANINGEALAEADVMVVIAFGQKIGPAAVHHPRLGSVNLHASRLPRYRGAAPIHHAILEGETITGNSIIRLAERMDAGAILNQSQVAIGELETTGELHDRLAEDGAGLMLATLAELAAGTAREIEQEEACATAAPKLDRQAARLDFTQSAEMLARRIRGLYPWPGCRVRLVDAAGGELGRLTLVRARAVDAQTAAGPGQLTSGGLIAAGAGRGGLEVIEVQPEGKRAMSLEAYRNGRAWPAGARVESIV